MNNPTSYWNDLGALRKEFDELSRQLAAMQVAQNAALVTLQRLSAAIQKLTRSTQ